MYQSTIGSGEPHASLSSTPAARCFHCVYVFFLSNVASTVLWREIFFYQMIMKTTRILLIHCYRRKRGIITLEWFENGAQSSGSAIRFSHVATKPITDRHIFTWPFSSRIQASGERLFGGDSWQCAAVKKSASLTNGIGDAALWPPSPLHHARGRSLCCCRRCGNVNETESYEGEGWAYGRNTSMKPNPRPEYTVQCTSWSR